MPKQKIPILDFNAHEIGPRNRRSGTVLPEVAHPYAELARSELQIDFANPTGETPYLDALQLANDSDNLSFLVGEGWAAKQRAKKLSGQNAASARGAAEKTIELLESH